MLEEYWIKQDPAKPLYEDILWSRPESKQTAGKLLIIGGNAHGFAVPAEAYQAAAKAGIGTAKVLLPDVLQKSVGSAWEDCEFAPSTPSGGFAKTALNEMLIQASWADGVILAGDLGRSAETTILLEEFVKKYTGKLTITRDAVDYFYHLPEIIAERPDTSIVLSLSQMQKLGNGLHFETPFLLSMGLMLVVQALHNFTLRYPAVILTKELEQLIVGLNGQIVTTKTGNDNDLWRVSVAARAAVFWLQNPGKILPSFASSLVTEEL